VLFNDREERGSRSDERYISGWFVFIGGEKVVLSFVSACADCGVRRFGFCFKCSLVRFCRVKL
jgi:hypothetical protein